MRLTFVVNNYPPRMGGVESHVQALAAELVRNGHETIVVTLGDQTGWRDDDGVSVLTLPEKFRVADTLGFPRWGTRRRLTQLLREREIDVVSVHTRFFPMSFVGWRAAKKIGVPVVHTEHGSNYVVHSSAVISLASRIMDHTLGRAVLRGVDRVVGVSEESAGFVRRLAGVSAGVFYNAINAPDRSAPAPDDSSDRLLFVGRIVPGKGWDDYLGLIAGLREQGLQVRGEMLGDGTDMPSLLDQVQRLGLSEVVDVRGRVSPLQVRQSLRGATLVNPTVLSEGFQTTLLEAIAEQGRVVTYPVPGAEKLREEGAPVKITERRDLAALLEATQALLADPPPLLGPEAVQHWTWPERATQYVGLCREVLDARHSVDEH